MDRFREAPVHDRQLSAFGYQDPVCQTVRQDEHLIVSVRGQDPVVDAREGIVDELPVVVEQDLRAFRDARRHRQAQFVVIVQMQRIAVDAVVDLGSRQRQRPVLLFTKIDDGDRFGKTRGMAQQTVGALSLAGLDAQRQVGYGQPRQVVDKNGLFRLAIRDIQRQIEPGAVYRSQKREFLARPDTPHQPAIVLQRDRFDGAVDGRRGQCTAG